MVKTPTRLEVAVIALLKLKDEKGEQFIRSMPSGALRQGLDLEGAPYTMSEISESTINLARRQILRGYYGGR